MQEKTITIIGVPMDFGSGRRGVDMGPSAIRYAGLRQGLSSLGHTLNDLGNISVPFEDNCRVGDSRMKYLEPIIEVNQVLAKHVSAAVLRGDIPLVLGGDHSLALGSIAGAARHRKLGVIWLDTHGDFNTHETSPSGNVHGMPLAALCGYGHESLITLGGSEPAGAKVRPENVVVVGARDLDPEERALMKEAGVHVFSMTAVDRLGMYEVMNRAIRLASQDTDGIYLSLDLDALDPVEAPGVGTPAPGGLTIREAHLAAEMLAASGHLLGVDLVEVNPILDQANQTALVAVDLALSAFGKSVWDEEL